MIDTDPKMALYEYTHEEIVKFHHKDQHFFKVTNFIRHLVSVHGDSGVNSSRKKHFYANQHIWNQFNWVHTVFQVRDWFQNELPSSRLNRTPPMGAPKAAATPAAAPAETKSRLSLE